MEHIHFSFVHEWISNVNKKFKFTVSLRGNKMYSVSARKQNVRSLTIKFVNLSRQKCYIPHCWIPPWSPSKYSPWEVTHRCQRVVHPSKQFWKWFCEITFRDAVVLLLMSSMSSKCLPFNFPLSLGTEKSHWGLDPVNRHGVPTQLFV